MRFKNRERRMTRKGQTLSHRLILRGIFITWIIGGVVGVQGYRLITQTAHREAEARVQDANRVASRLLQAEVDRLQTNGNRVELVSESEAASSPSLAALLRTTRKYGNAKGFVLLNRGLCLASAKLDQSKGEVNVAVLPLSGENRLPDQIRDLVFGSGSDNGMPQATITIFEKDVRIATNVVTARGERAIGTRAAPEVAARVLGQGLAWNDRARVLDRWTIASYEPIRSEDGKVLGMLYAGLDEAPYTAQRRRDSVQFLVSIAVLSLLVSWLVWWFARQVARPLGALTTAAMALGVGSPKLITVDSADPKEIQVLGETFNQMSKQIQTRTTELEVSREIAQKALDDYMEVLGFVAHELKSPLAGARMQLMMINDGYAGEVSESMKRPIGAMGRALDYGLEVVHSFNQLSRAEGEGFVAKLVNIEDFGVEVVRPAMADSESQALARGIKLTLEAEAKRLRGDPDLLRVVMDNLIGNAIKYGREGSTVRISTRQDDNGMRVEVYNEGIGVAPDKIAKLFQKFYRVHDPETKLTKGTGVGLYLVRRFVELQGGVVGAESEHGAWIRFWFRIPCGALTAAE
jgi:two-component system, NtrC family, sensor kinase